MFEREEKTLRSSSDWMDPYGEIKKKKRQA